MASGCGERVLYIATAKPIDSEMSDRIKRHRERRSASWETVEYHSHVPDDLRKRSGDFDAILFDCVTIFISNILIESSIDWERCGPVELVGLEQGIRDELGRLVNAAAEADICLIIVTNEVGMGIVPDNAISRIFRDIAGRVNQELAAIADEVYLCVCGLPTRIK